MGDRTANDDERPLIAGRVAVFETQGLHLTFGIELITRDQHRLRKRRWLVQIIFSSHRIAQSADHIPPNFIFLFLFFFFLIMDGGATNDINNVILSRPTPPDVTTPQTPPPRLHLNVGGGGQTTPPSPFTDTSSSALAPSASATGTPYTDLTSLPSDVSKLSLSPAKKTPLTEPPAPSWPYSHCVALGDIPGVAYALDTFLKSRMVESEEYCHRIDPRKCVSS